MQYRNPINGNIYEEWELEERATQLGITLEEFIEQNNLIEEIGISIDDEEVSEEDFDPGIPTFATDYDWSSSGTLDFIPGQEQLDTPVDDDYHSNLYNEPEKESDISHPINPWATAESDIGSMEGTVVDWLNNAYSDQSDKVRFVEAEFGFDTVEVLLGDQKEGEGKEFNLSFNRKNNLVCFITKSISSQVGDQDVHYPCDIPTRKFHENLNYS